MAFWAFIFLCCIPFFAIALILFAVTWPFDRRRLAELVTLYRRGAEDLARARALTVNPEVLDRLNVLIGRAYRVVHGTRRRGFRWSAVGDFYTRDLPAALTRCVRNALVCTSSISIT